MKSKFKSNLAIKAEQELELLRKEVPDSVIREFHQPILQLCETFGNSGQSGSSAPYLINSVVDTIKKLLNFNTLVPVKGTKDEFRKVGSSSFQNIRESAIFKEGEDGRPYYLDAVIFQGEDEFDRFTGKVEGINSRQYIKEFPFIPKSFTVHVTRALYDKEIHDENSRVVYCGSGNYVYKIKYYSELKNVFEYYDRFES